MILRIRFNGVLRHGIRGEVTYGIECMASRLDLQFTCRAF